MAGTLIISLDFELFWGMLDVCPLEKYQDHVLGGRKAIPGLLALFQKYGIHATWATVGYLFAEFLCRVLQNRRNGSGRALLFCPVSD